MFGHCIYVIHAEDILIVMSYVEIEKWLDLLNNGAVSQEITTSVKKETFKKNCESNHEIIITKNKFEN